MFGHTMPIDNHAEPCAAMTSCHFKHSDAFIAQYGTVLAEPPEADKTPAMRLHWREVHRLAETNPAILTMNHVDQSNTICAEHKRGEK